MAAHQFLERNDLSQMFLDQVVDFILKNTKGVTIGQQTPAAGDPFTGMKLLTPPPPPLWDVLLILRMFLPSELKMASLSTDESDDSENFTIQKSSRFFFRFFQLA